MTTFDALYLARGWLSVALASQPDKDRPALDRTVNVELFPSGVRLVATDSYMLLRAWVPAIDQADEPEPSLDEAPVATAVARDSHGRAVGLLSHLYGLATAKDAPLVECRLNLGVTDEADATSFAGMEATYVLLDHPDCERVKLVCYEGSYPHWRKLVDGFRTVKTDAIALNPNLIGRLAKLGKFHPDQPLVWRWGGRYKTALVEVEGALSGLVMPMRWDLDRNAPAIDEAS